MKNPFTAAKNGFDSVVAKGHVITGSLELEPGSTTVFDGTMTGESIEVGISKDIKDESPSKTTLVINGTVRALKRIEVPNVTITGEVRCDVLHVSGVLAIKRGAVVRVSTLRYETLVVETGAVISGSFEHISSGAEINTQLEA